MFVTFFCFEPKEKNFCLKNARNICNYGGRIVILRDKGEKITSRELPCQEKSTQVKAIVSEVSEMEVGSKSDIGLVRKNNEDTYFIDSINGLYLVADGMGGHENGKLASALAADAFARLVKGHQGESLVLDDLKVMLNQANQVVYRYQEDIAGKIMGTTLTATLVHDGEALIAHIGDSRLYLINDKGITQLTHDHSYYAELARLGEFDEDILPPGRQKNVLVRALGPEENMEGQYLTQSLLVGDVMLLCTDGLYGLISDEELKDMIAQTPTLQEAAEGLVALARSRGGFDNITVVIFRYE